MKRIVLLLCLAAGALFAAADGQWNAEFMSYSKKSGTTKTTTATLDLHTSQGVLTGTVSGQGKKARALTIENGKIDGDKFYFTTVRTSKKGEEKYTWQGTIQGDQINGERMKAGAKRGQKFMANRRS